MKVCSLLPVILIAIGVAMVIRGINQLVVKRNGHLGWFWSGFFVMYLSAVAVKFC